MTKTTTPNTSSAATLEITPEKGAMTYAIAYYQGDRRRLQVVGINTPAADTLRQTEALASRRQSTNFVEMCAYARELALKNGCEYVRHRLEEPDYLD